MGQSQTSRGKGMLRPPRLLGGTAEARTGVAFVGPAVLLILLVVGYPLVETFRLSFFKSVGGAEASFVGLANYVEQLFDATFWAVMRNTVVWTVGSVSLQMLIGFWAAMVVHRSFRGSLIFRLLFLLPWTVPGIVRAEAWKWLYHPLFGVLNQMLMSLGVIEVPIAWLGDPRFALPAVILENVWGMFPFVMIMVLAGLQAIPKQLYEAAAVDGAHGWRVTAHVTLPQLRPVLFAVGLLLTVWTMNSFTGLYIMTKGGPGISSTTASLYIYQLGIVNWDFGRGSTVALLLFVMTLAVSILYLKSFGEKEAR